MLNVEFETTEFKKYINKVIAESDVNSNKALKKICFDLLGNIIRRNPVDTGQSRAAWYPSAKGLKLRFNFNSKVKGDRNRVAEGMKEGSFSESWN